jgi:Zn-dependent M28 family amino/carboxypeptidase
MRMKGFPRKSIAGAVAVALLVPAPGLGAVKVNTSKLRKAVTVENVRAHQQVFQDIANVASSGGTRASGTPGYDKSAAYVARRAAAAGYKVTIQSFVFPFFHELEPAELEQIEPDAVAYGYFEPDGFATMEYSGSGDVTALTQAVDLVLPPTPDPSSTSGCEPEDFAGFEAGRIAVVQRGTCDFAVKAANAEGAGAVGVIIFNEGQPGRTEAVAGTLGGPAATVPVVGAAFDVGLALAEAGVTVRMFVNAQSENRETANVIADSPGGRADRVVVVGAHLDSVPEGPGINDNGSGSAAILEVARQIRKLRIKPHNKLRFAWWGAEESGLIGSQHYIDSLGIQDLANIAMNLNFDMVGSPNFVRFVYDGDGSDTPLSGPLGSELIEAVFLDYFDNKGLPTEPTAFDGRSDYGPFIEAGIPAGGLFTGAEVLKTEEEAAIYGGTAGVAHDPCYHQACDTFDNNSDEVLDQMSDAIAHAVQTFAMSRAPVNARISRALAAQSVEGALLYKGSKLRK